MLVVVVLAFGAAVVLRISIATWLVAEALEDTPFKGSDFQLSSLDHRRVVIDNVVLRHPFDVQIAQVSITFDPVDAIAGRLDSVTIDGLTATATPDDLSALSGSSDDSGPQVNIGVVTLRDGNLHLVADDDQLDVKLSGDLTDIASPQGSFDVTVSGSMFTLTGPLNVTSEDNSDILAAWKIEDGSLTSSAARLGAVTGDVLFELAGKGEAGVALNLALSSSDVSLDRYNLDHLHIELASRSELPVNLATTTAQAFVEIGTPGGPVHGRAALDLGQLGDNQQLMLDLDADLNEDLTLGADRSTVIAAPSMLTSHVVADLPETIETDVLDPISMVLAHVSSMTSEFQFAAVDIDGRFAATTASGQVAVQLNGDDADITFETPVNITGLQIDPSWLDEQELSSEIADLLATPSSIKLSGNGSPWRLTRQADGISRVDGGGTLELNRTDLTATVLFDGVAAIQPEGNLEAATLRHGNIKIDVDELVGAAGLHIEGDGRAIYDGHSLDSQASLTVAAAKLDVDAASFQDVNMSLPFEASMSDGVVAFTLQPVALMSAAESRLGDLKTGPVEIELPLRVAAMSNSAMLYVDDNGWVDVTGVSHPNFVVAEPVSIRIEQSTLPLLSIEITGNGEPIWDVRLQFGSTAMTAAILDDDGMPTAHISGTLPSGSVHGTQLIKSYISATLETNDGTLRWREEGIEVSGLRTLLTYNSGLSEWPQMRLDVSEITDTRSPARFVPLRADLRISPVWPIGDDVRMSFNVHAPAKRYALNVEASYEAAHNKATALVRLPPLVFEPGVYQPKDLSPLMGSYTDDVTGSVEVTGDVTWQDGNVASDLNLAIRDLSATAFGTRMERMNTLINFDGILPPSTPPEQLVAIAGIDAGLPMRDALISLSLDPDGILVLESAEMKFAGGEVTSDRAIWRIGSDPEPILLNVTGVDVGALFDLADMDELTATGTLDGTIPVRFSEGDLIIEDASLASRQPGELRYLPIGGPADLGTDEASLDLVLEALSNFHYERLEVDLDRAAGGETEIGLHIAGANPDLYDGYPIELNVSLTGALDQIVRDSLAGYRIPDEIRERLSGF